MNFHKLMEIFLIELPFVNKTHSITFELCCVFPNAAVVLGKRDCILFIYSIQVTKNWKSLLNELVWIYSPTYVYMKTFGVLW